MFENDHFQNCVYFRWGFFSAETTCTADVLHSYLVFSIYFCVYNLPFEIEALKWSSQIKHVIWCIKGTKITERY